MAFTDAELEKKLKDVGKQLSHPPDSVDELVAVLDVSPKFVFFMCLFKQKFSF